MESQQSRMWRGVFRRKEEENEQANWRERWWKRWREEVKKKRKPSGVWMPGPKNNTLCDQRRYSANSRSGFITSGTRGCQHFQWFETAHNQCFQIPTHTRTHTHTHTHQWQATSAAACYRPLPQVPQQLFSYRHLSVWINRPPCSSRDPLWPASSTSPPSTNNGRYRGS